MKYVASILALFAFSHLPAVSQNQQQERIRIEPKTDVVKRSAPPQNAVLDRLIALDKEASSRVSSLSHLRRSTWRSVSASSKRNAHIQAEYKLSASRLSEGSKATPRSYHINRDLEDAYIAASSDLTVDNRVLLIRLAALHWHSIASQVQRSIKTAPASVEMRPCRMGTGTCKPHLN